MVFTWKLVNLLMNMWPVPLQTFLAMKLPRRIILSNKIKKNRPTRMYFGEEDAVEHIDFQLPGQKTHEVEEEAEGDSGVEWTEQIGSVDPNRPASKHPCSGCGAKVHCKVCLLYFIKRTYLRTVLFPVFCLSNFLKRSKRRKHSKKTFFVGDVTF